MLAVCSTVRENGQDMPLDEHRLARVRQTTEG
jgi:Mg2+-importing ATPase